MKFDKEEVNFKKEVEKDIKVDRKYHEIVAAYILLIIFVIFIGFGIWWYLTNQNLNDDYSTKLNFKKRTDVSEISDTADWKTYTSTKYGFTIKYPPTWVVTENAKSETSEVSYVGLNIFSKDNVIFVNKNDHYAISISMDEIFGRGGTCVKKNIIYNTEIIANKLVLSNKKITDNFVGENLMCETSSLTGYSISTIPKSGSGYLVKSGHNYFFYSGSPNVPDSKIEEVTKYFEKILLTMKWN